MLIDIRFLRTRLLFREAANKYVVGFDKDAFTYDPMRVELVVVVVRFAVLHVRYTRDIGRVRVITFFVDGDCAVRIRDKEPAFDRLLVDNHTVFLVQARVVATIATMQLILRSHDRYCLQTARPGS